MAELDKASQLQKFGWLIAALLLPAVPLGAVDTGSELEATREAMRSVEQEQQTRLREIERIERQASEIARRSQRLREEQRGLESAVAEQNRAVELRAREAQELEKELSLAREQALLLLRAHWLRERHRGWQPEDARLERHQRELDVRIQLRREDSLAQLAQQSAALNAARDRLAEARDELVARETEARRLLRDITRTENELASLLARIELEFESDAVELKRLARNAETLEQVLRRMRERPPPAALAAQPTPADGGRFAGRRGSLPPPVDGAFLHRYGSPRNGAVHASWRGEVFQTGDDTPVHAVHAGRTVYADWMRGFGFVVILDHGEGYLTLYGNARELLTRQGDRVSAGQVIARAGATSAVIAPGLYFELRHNGETLNPRSWWHSK